MSTVPSCKFPFMCTGTALFPKRPRKCVLGSSPLSFCGHHFGESLEGDSSGRKCNSELLSLSSSVRVRSLRALALMEGFVGWAQHCEGGTSLVYFHSASFSCPDQRGAEVSCLFRSQVGPISGPDPATLEVVRLSLGFQR
jgi:hypothetical protein